MNLARFGFGGKSSLQNNCNIYAIGKCIYVKGKICYNKSAHPPFFPQS